MLYQNELSKKEVVTMMANLPAGLQHVLEVYRLVRMSHHSRAKAVNEVARKHRIDPQTIRSACTRSLGIATADLDDFLLPENSKDFCSYLVRRFPPQQKEIEEYFQELDGKDTVYTTIQPQSYARCFKLKRRTLYGGCCSTVFGKSCRSGRTGTTFPKT